MYSKRLTFIKFDQCSDIARDQNVAMLFSLKLEAILDAEHSKQLKWAKDQRLYTLSSTNVAIKFFNL